MIRIENNDSIISDHEIFELARAFFKDEAIITSNLNNNIYPRLSLKLSKDNLVYRGIIIDSNNFSISKEMRIDSLNIYRDQSSTRRIVAKQIIYKLFEKFSGISLPWGVLTGIRPSKIVHRLFDLNINSEQILNVLTWGYLISLEKAILLINIAKNQREVLKSIGKKTYSIYVNVPFCPSRCSYCSFPSLSAKVYSNEMGQYVDNLLKEIKLSMGKLDKWNINSVYVGGGTPTSLNYSLMERLISEIRNIYPDISEFSIEAGRPDTLDYKYLELFKKYEIDRISINPQTMNDKTLKRINRSHSVEDIVTCFKQAREIGIKSINMDIILGLPGERVSDLNCTLNQLKKLEPDNLTVHVLAIKTGSEYKNNYKQDSFNEINEMINISRLAAIDMKLDPYYLYRQKNSLGNFENIGYASEGKICTYNISIMEEKETIIGIGMGAVSKIYDKERDKLYRIPNYKNLNDYTNKLEEQVWKKNNKIPSPSI